MSWLKTPVQSSQRLCGQEFGQGTTAWLVSAQVVWTPPEGDPKERGDPPEAGSRFLLPVVGASAPLRPVCLPARPGWAFSWPGSCFQVRALREQVGDA